MACATNTPNCNCKKTPCGCEKGINAAPPCASGTPECPNPEPCAETFSDCCVIHNGQSIISPNEPNLYFPILNGERLCDTMQKLVLWLKDPDCVTGTCPPPLGVLVKSYTSSTVTIGWTPAPGATQYVLEFWNPATSLWVPQVPIPASSNPQFTFTGLSSNTTYYFRVYNYCIVQGTCPSVSIQQKTLA